MERGSVPFAANMTWTELNDLLQLKPVGLLPVGAIEAHGPHLPLNSDVIIATAMAQSGGAHLYKRGIPAVILPPLSYSVSFAGICFSGTTPLSPSTFQQVLTDVLRSHASQGYRTICICNAHLEPAHVDAIHQTLERLQREVLIPLTFPDQRVGEWAEQLGEEFQRGSRHAGSYETSIVMATSPDSVRRVALEELAPLWIDLPAKLKSGARDFAEAGSPLGYFGDPGAATPHHGEELLGKLGEMILETVLAALVRNDDGS